MTIAQSRAAVEYAYRGWEAYRAIARTIVQPSRESPQRVEAPRGEKGEGDDDRR